MLNSSPKYIENPSMKGKEHKYIQITVNLDKVVQSWRESLFSFEWLLPNGSVRSRDELIEKEQIKYDTVLKKLSDNQSLPMPILGIGVMDNVEIGSGRENLLTLYAHNVKSLPVHIPKDDKKEFQVYCTK